MGNGHGLHQHSAHYDLGGIQAAVLTNKGVQRELKLNDVQADRVATLVAEVAVRGREGAKALESLPQAERRLKMHNLMTEACEEAMTTLRGIFTPEQYKRFDQIVLQQRGIMGFTDAEIQTRLKLNAEQRNQVTTLAGSFHTRLQELSRNASADSIKKVHDEGMALYQKAAEEAVALLNDGQKATWKELIGERFDFRLEGRAASGQAVTAK